MADWICLLSLAAVAMINLGGWLATRPAPVSPVHLRDQVSADVVSALDTALREARDQVAQLEHRNIQLEAQNKRLVEELATTRRQNARGDRMESYRPRQPVFQTDSDSGTVRARR